jgi:hypothetical protein
MLKLITLEEIKEKSAKEIAEIYTQDIENLKKELESNTIDELKELEKEILEEQDKFNDYVKTIEYEIPRDLTWDNTKYSRNEIYSKIIYFLNKNEVQFAYTLGLYELIKFWKNFSNDKISYGAFDSTLRLLEQVKFKGFEEYRDILAINEFFKPMHEGYTIDISRSIYLAQVHNEIISRMELITPMNKTEE